MKKEDESEMAIQGSNTTYLKTIKHKLRSAATSLFDVRRWTFDVRCSILLIFLISFTTTKDVPADSWFAVKYVNDGDTIVLTNGKRVRYIGINTPEIDHQNHRAQPFGYEARAFNKKMVLNRKIRLEFDQEDHDRYGRRLAYIFLTDGTFLNENLLQMGYAYFLFKKPNLKYNQRLLKAQQEAMKAGRGLWSNWNERKRRYVGNRNSKRFHLDSCSSAGKIKQKNRTRFSTRWEAFMAGYAPARGCIKELRDSNANNS
jgi:micrococcal nuclease